MNILFLTRDLPYPADSGYKKRNFYLLRDLAHRGMKVFLVSKKPQDLNPEYLTELKRYCAKIELVDIRESRLTKLTWAFLSLFWHLPFFVLARTSSKMHSLGLRI